MLDGRGDKEPRINRRSDGDAVNKDPLEPVAVASFVSELEAQAVANALTEAGIQAQAVGGFVAGFKAEAPGENKVVVAQQDEAKARQLLEVREDKAEEIDWDNVDVGKPEE